MPDKRMLAKASLHGLILLKMTKRLIASSLLLLSLLEPREMLELIALLMIIILPLTGLKKPS